MAAYGPSTGRYSAASIRAARKTNGSGGSTLSKDSSGKYTVYTPDSSGYESKLTGSSISSNISNMYDQQAASETAALRQAIQKSVADQQKTIDTADQTYQPLKNDSEVQKYSDLRTALEQSANQGDRGGIGRQVALDTQTQGENRLNGINLQQQNLVNTAKQNISDINSSGSLQEQQINANNAASKLKALIEQQQTDQAQARTDALANINADYSDLQAKANSLANDGDPSNDWKIPYYNTARVNKIYGNDDITTAQNAIAQQDFDNSVASQQLANDTAATNYQIGKPYYNPKSGSRSSKSSSKPALSASAALSAYENNVRTPQVLAAVKYYYGDI